MTRNRIILSTGYELFYSHLIPAFISVNLPVDATVPVCDAQTALFTGHPQTESLLCLGRRRKMRPSRETNVVSVVIGDH